jgi:cephalosporin hydroxylase
MSILDEHLQEVARNIAGQAADFELQSASIAWLAAAGKHRYSYNFNWLGRPIIQCPQDIVAMQELIWTIQPDLIIETGVAHGGSLIFSASMLELNAICGGNPDASVVGIDIDIRVHNRLAIEAHPLSKRITLLEGSSISPEIVDQVRVLAEKKKQVLVCLDSNHSHDHVLSELNAYAPLVSVGSYCVVFDTLIEDMPEGSFPGRPWNKAGNPKTAVYEYLKSHDQFMIDRNMNYKLLLTVAPDGFLRRTS